MRVYEIPWSKEVFDAMMKHIRNGIVGLHISDIRASRTYVPRTVDEFLTDEENLEELIKSYERPPATYNFNIQPEKLAKYLQMDAAAEKQDHYG
jgi:hypothetical protein